MISRRTFLQTAGIAPLVFGQMATKPNLVFLFTDDQRFSTLHAINNPDVATPNMDRIAARSTVFEKAFIMGGTIGAVCAPSRAMLITGQTLFNVTDSIVDPKQNNRTPKPFHMWPEELRNNGYTTVGIGKWHNGPKLYSRCFSNGGPIMFGGMSDHLKVPVQDYDPSSEYPLKRTYTGKKFSSELFADSAIQFLERQGDGAFAMYVAFTAPHDPRMAPQRFKDMYPANKIKLPGNFLPEHPFDNGEMKIRDEALLGWPRTEQAVKQEIADYYAMITEVDEQIGRILDTLEKTGKDQNTILIFAADNGLAVGQHGLLGKQNLYDHSIRVPLMIAGPGLPKGKKSNALVYLLDLFPTLFDLMGLNTPATVEGKSLAPILKGETNSVRDSIFVAYRGLMRAVRDQDWKWIEYNVNGKRTLQLFNLAIDPLEKSNLAQLPANEARIKKMKSLLKHWMKEVNDPQMGSFGS